MEHIDSFNKSHSASYAKLSYQTAYLKCHYPLYFYASQMSQVKTDGDGQNKIVGFIAECKARGITINPPDINTSSHRFTVSNGSINYRITAIKHVGESAIKHINELRPITSFDDFLQRRQKKYIKKNVMVNLIKAGCFDFDNPNRAELLWKLDMSDRTNKEIKDGYICPKYEWNDKIKREWEREVLGLYLSSHPMEKYSFKELHKYDDGGYALQGGEVIEVYAFHPKKDPKRPEMAWVTINTLYGNVKCVVFANTWKRQDVREHCQIGNIIMVRGKRQGSEILVDSTEILE